MDASYRLNVEDDGDETSNDGAKGAAMGDDWAWNQSNRALRPRAGQATRR